MARRVVRLSAAVVVLCAPPAAALIVTSAAAITPGYDSMSRTVSRLAVPGMPAAAAVDVFLAVPGLEPRFGSIEDRGGQREISRGREAVGDVLDVSVDAEDLLNDDETVWKTAHPRILRAVSQGDEGDARGELSRLHDVSAERIGAMHAPTQPAEAIPA